MSRRSPKPIRSRSKRQTAAGFRALQRLTLSTIIQPLGPGDRTRAVWRDGRAMKDVAAEFIKPNSRLTSLERLEIYNRQYWFRVLDCLYDDYPGLRAILGERRFRQLSIAYLTRYPSNSFTLRDLGARLEKFLIDEPHWTSSREAISIEMARFEWAQIVAFDTAQRPPLSSDDLLGENPARLRLSLQPYLSLLHLGFPLDDFVLSVKKGPTGTDSANRAAAGMHRLASSARPRLPKPEEVFVAVHRLENDIYYKRLSRAQHQVLSALQSGDTLVNACSTALGEGDDGLGASQVREWFQGWMALGWFCRRSEHVTKVTARSGRTRKEGTQSPGRMATSR